MKEVQSTKLKTQNLGTRIASGIILVTIITTTCGQLLSPQKAAAQVAGPSVPIYSSGGQIQRVGTVALDKTAEKYSIWKAMAIAAFNSAMQSLTTKFLGTMQSKLKVGSTLNYQDALVESKYLVDALRKSHGEDAVKIGGGTTALVAESVFDIASQFEALPLNNMASQSVSDLAIQQLRTQYPAVRERNMQKLIVGASTMFTSAISCGGINEKALDNTARYLAAASAGINSRDIDPRNPLQFYESMARFGNPNTNTQFWKTQLEQLGKENESRARQAAVLELTSPGLKATQVRTAGGTKTQTSLSFISAGEQNAQNSLFNIAIKGTEGPYSTSSFGAFLTSAISNGIDQLLPFFGINLNSDVTSFGNQMVQLGTQVGKNIVSNYAVSLYNKLASQIFQGEILAESPNCGRRAPVRGTFTAADRRFVPPDTDNDVNNFLGGSTNTTPTEELIFNVSSGSITGGEIVTLNWDATLLTGVSTVTISGGNVGGDKPVAGFVEDTPLVTTTYTATAGGKSVSRTVTVAPRSTSLLNAEPLGTEPGRAVLVSWDAAGLNPLNITIEPLSNIQGAQGQQCYTPTSDDENAGLVEFFMTVEPNVGVPVTSDVIVTVDPPTVTFEAEDTTICTDETTALSWDIDGYNSTLVSINGGQVARVGQLDVGIGDYELAIDETNSCDTRLFTSSISVVLDSGCPVP